MKGLKMNVLTEVFICGMSLWLLAFSMVVSFLISLCGPSAPQSQQPTPIGYSEAYQGA